MDQTTLAPEATEGPGEEPLVCSLTIAYHPDASRIGERLSIPLGQRAPTKVSRSAPEFAAVDGTRRPLEDPHVSRSPIEIADRWPRGFELRPGSGTRVRVDGETLQRARSFGAGELSRGVVIELGGAVLLVLHVAGSGDAGDLGLIGPSSGLAQVRAGIRNVAPVDVPVLIRGETGVGKERVAQAIHAASGRSEQPMVAVNMAAISRTTAVSELFGHVRGAFTGATSPREGLFERAHGGTLFLDEIGETPGDIQPMLLRVLETGTITPVGGSEERLVDVRLVAATDADLEAAADAGAFRGALLHRLAGYELRVPPLRDRRADIAQLALAFLREQLMELDALDRLDRTDRPWFPRSLMATLLLHAWPGNVRQLRNVIRQIVISSRDAEVARADGVVATQLAADQAPGDATGSAREIDEDRLVAALKANGWAPGPAANALGIPRSTIYYLMSKSDRVRTATEVSREELERCHADCSGDVGAMTERLQVSARGLQLRLKQLGIGHE